MQVIHERMVIHHFDPRRPSLGGIDTCIRDLVRFGREARFVFVASSLDHSHRSTATWQSVTLEDREVDVCYVARHGTRRPLPPNALRFAAGLRKYRAHIRSRPPDVVQVHRPELVPIARRLFPEVALDLFLHEDAQDWNRITSESRWRSISSMYRRVVTAGVERADRVVCFSPSAAARLAERYPHIVDTPTWFNPERFAPSSRPDKESRRLLWVGRLSTQKDPCLAVEVLRHLPAPWHLTLVGDGRLREELLSAIQAAGLHGRTTLTGAVSKARVAELMRTHDVVLMTSHSEGYPRVLIEALASGRPVVATSEADTGRLLEPGTTGGRARSRSPAELASLVEAVRDLSPESCYAAVEDLAASRVVARILSAQHG